MMTTKKTKILIVDDSAVSRDLLSFIIQSDPTLEVIATAENGEQAIELNNSLNPDLIMMDIVMPKMNGFDATKKIMETNPKPIIIVSGVFNKDEITKAFDAIHAGAMTIIEKPKGVGDKQYIDTARFVLETVKALAIVNVSKFNHETDKKTTVAESLSTETAQTISIAAIGASIGGPQALSQILSQLPSNFPVPILVIQHISSGFIEGYANWLNSTTKLNVQVAKNGEKAKAGTVYLAPDKHQLMVTKEGLLVVDEITSETNGQPTIDTLFQSIATSYKNRGVGILLSGVGRDGLKGLKSIKEAGGIAMVQDPTTAMLPDLPSAAINANAASYVETLAKIPATLILLTKKMALT